MLSKIEELKLVAQCALGDNRRAFATLVEAYQPRVRRMMLNLTCGDEYLSDDLAQETFIKAWLALRSFKGISSFSTWLYRIGYNEFYSHMRRQRETPLGDRPLPQEAHESAVATEAALDVRAALASLGEAERAVVTLHYLDDLPLKKIATIMSLPLGTVKSHLHRAKGKMQHLLLTD